MPDDPRKRSAPKTVNQLLEDAVLRHMHFVERFKGHEVNKITAILTQQIIPDLQRQIRSGRGTAWTRARLQRLNRALQTMLGLRFANAGTVLIKDLQDFAVFEANWQASSFEKAIPDIGFTFTTPSEASLRAMATFSTYEGHTTKFWMQSLSRKTAKAVAAEVATGVTLGETIPQISKRVQQAAETSIRHARSITRTSVNHVSNTARQMTYGTNARVIKGWKFLATLDARTTDICMSHDGNVYGINEGAKDRPPLHHQCRSTTTPIMKSAEEFGLNNIPESTRPFVNETMTGQVPATTTYNSWLKTQSKEFQDNVLGPGRAKLFRETRVPLKRFVNNRNRPLTLKELQKIRDTEYV